jgi:hypothetical protein
MYSIDGLENGIMEARKHIVYLEEAIEKERQTIKDYRIKIDEIERASSLKAEAEAGINIEVVKE